MNCSWIAPACAHSHFQPAALTDTQQVLYHTDSKPPPVRSAPFSGWTSKMVSWHAPWSVSVGFFGVALQTNHHPYPSHRMEYKFHDASKTCNARRLFGRTARWLSTSHEHPNTRKLSNSPHSCMVCHTESVCTRHHRRCCCPEEWRHGVVRTARVCIFVAKSRVEFRAHSKQALPGLKSFFMMPCDHLQ